MTSTDWHVLPEDLERYAAGQAPPSVEASVEAHLLSCPACRLAVGAVVERLDPGRGERRWASIVPRIDQPRPTIVERLLLAIGVPDGQARTLVATPRLLSAWLGSLLVVLVLALVAGQAGSGKAALTVFLLVAPILPLLGTAILYSPAAEPPGALAMATPGRDGRLLLARSLLVLGTCVPVLLVAGAVLPGPAAAGTAWLLPALGMASLVLASARVVDPARSAWALGAAWTLGVLATSVGGIHRPLGAYAHDLLPLRPGAQLVFALLAVVAGAVAFLQRNDLPLRVGR